MPGKAKAAQLVVATETFWLAKTDKLPERVVNQGDVMDASDPVVKANPGRFVTPEEAYERLGVGPVSFGAVESATAAPGEKR